MNELLVMRHAKSDWSTGGADFDRPLNSRGRSAADQMGAWLCEQQLCPGRVISSPATRARSTAMAVVSECGTDQAHVEFEDHGYLADAFTWQQILATQPAGRLLICGHNPGLDDLVDYLSSSSAPESASGKLMTTAAVAHFRVDTDWSDLSPACCALVQLVRPRELD
jgi:phosphohistidine phosphatase